MKPRSLDSRTRGFSLIELLVVIAIIALLSSIVFTLLSTGRAKARDARRVADLSQLQKAVMVYESSAGNVTLGSSTVVYTSLPDSSPTCASWTLPALQSGWTYHCVLGSTLRAVNGTGWVPIDFANSSGDSFLNILPVDPVNNAASHYSYIAPQSGNSYAFNASTIEQQNAFLNSNTIGNGYTLGSSLAYSSALAPITPPVTLTPVTIGNPGSVTSAGLTASAGQISFSPVTSYGAGLISSGAVLKSAPGAGLFGAHALQRPDGKFLIFVGGVTSNTTLYDPQANTAAVGPTATGNIGSGSFSIERPDGKFLIAIGNGSTPTAIYDPVANTFVAGPNTTNSVGIGSHAVKRPDGKFLIYLANGTAFTNIYDPVANTISAGPNASMTIGQGAISMLRPDGKFFTAVGANTPNTNIYDPVANSMAAGPSIGANVYYDAHALQRPDGKFLIVAGGQTTITRVYDPVAGTIVAGPALGGNAGYGSLSMQRADGKYLILRGAGGGETYIYDPVANTISAGPPSPYAVNYGAGSFQRPDGKYFYYTGNQTAFTLIYDAGWSTSGVYETEDISIPALNSASTLQYTLAGTGTVVTEVKTATTQGGLTSATYNTVANAALINPTAGAQWAKVRLTLTRSVPRPGSNSWPGVNDTKYFRTFDTPAVSGLGISN
jgi:prepilin-type N-terminal cleavage/methylation domain-containing protein